MRVWRIALLLGAALCFAAPCPAKLVRLPLDADGVAKLLQEHRGEVVALSFFATWCEPCREEFPDILCLRKHFAGAPFYLAIVSVDDLDEWDEKVVPFLKKHGVDFPVYLKKEGDDEKFINAVDPQWFGSLPAFFIFDGQGKLRQSFYEKQEFETLRKAVQKQLTRLSRNKKKGRK